MVFSNGGGGSEVEVNKLVHSLDPGVTTPMISGLVIKIIRMLRKLDQGKQANNSRTYCRAKDEVRPRFTKSYF